MSGPPCRFEPAAAAHRALAQAERLRRDLEQLVLADPLQALLEVHGARRRELDAVVRRGGAHVGELLFLGDVDVEVVVAAILADDLALVDRLARPHEHRAARLQIVDGIARGLAGPVSDQRAVLPVRDVTLPDVPPVEQMIE
jgi:hypothetical protein